MMADRKPKFSRNDLVIFAIDEFFDGDIDRVKNETGFSKQQIESWLAGHKQPQKGIVKWLFHVALSPDFQVIVEYLPINTLGAETTMRKQLSGALAGHEKSSGLYAFYDSMANLVYLGKSDGNLLGECYTQLHAAIKTNKFPKGVAQPDKRSDVVRYVSAYYVQRSEFQDYAKHVESLILRISKPVLNSNVGVLTKLEKKPILG